MRLPPILLLLLPILPALCGPGDTVDQLRMGFTIVPLADQVANAPVTVEQGSGAPSNRQVFALITGLKNGPK